MDRQIMNIDFDDEVAWRKTPMSPDDIRDALETSKRMGCDTVVWRCTTLGRADYRSDAMDRSDAPLFEDDLKRQTLSGKWKKILGDDARQYREIRAGYIDKCRVILKDYDPPAVAREWAAKMGLKLYLWLDLFDEYLPGLGSRFLRENPDCQWRSRDGREYYEGLRSYAFAKSVDQQLEVVRELLAYEPDGLYFCSSCHSRHKDRPGQNDFYGFEAPVVNRYRERYGTDIRSETFDLDAWHAIKGEFLTRFIEKAKALMAPKGVKLMLPAPIGDDIIQDLPLWSLNSPATIRCDWKNWVDRGLADSLIIGEYQPVWGGKTPQYWERIAGKSGLPETAPETAAAARIVAYAKGRAEVYYWSGWVHGGKLSRENVDRAIKAVQNAQREVPTDGAAWHELLSFEQLGYFPNLTRQIK